MSSYSYCFTASFIGANIICTFIDFMCPVFRVNKLDYETLKKNYLKALPTSLSNLFLTIPHLELSHYYLSQCKRNEAWFVTNLFWWLAFSDIFFYNMHRLCHTRFGYRVHKIHHEFNYTHGLTALHAHPIDYLLSNLFPMIAPVYMFKPPDYFINFLCAFMVAYTIIVSHGGYQFFNKSHLDHHLYRNKNYGLLVTDRVMGTKK